VQSDNTKLCLAAVGMFSDTVGQGPCGTVWSKWEVIGVATSPHGLIQLRNTGVNRCLDTNGTDVYFSPCWAEDRGQLWADGVADHELLISNDEGRAEARGLTAWNDGGVSVAETLGLAVPNIKQRWWFIR
jgi:hypothetical protein